MKTLLTLLIVVSMPSLRPADAQNPTYLKWRVYESENFVLYYPEGQEFTAFNAIEVAEQVHPHLSRMYGSPDSKVTLVIKDTEDFASGGAYFYDNKVEISATPLDFEFRSYHDWIWNVITHELSHIYSIKRSMKTTRRIPMAYYQHIDYQEEKREDVLVGYPNVIASYPLPMFNVPSWLAEGVAQYNARGAQYDRWDAHRDMILRQAVLNDKMLSIDDMATFTGTGREYEMVYDHGYALILYIADVYGEEKITALMDALGAKTAINFDVACKSVLGISQEQLYSEWKASLVKRYEAVRDSLGSLEEGVPFRIGGYLNGFPRWSPDGSRLAYVTNVGQDFSITMCRVADFSPGGWQWKNKEKDVDKLKRNLEKKLSAIEDSTEARKALIGSAGAFDITFAGGIQSVPVWLDEWNLLYNRFMSSDKYGSHWWDIYRYVINRENPRKGTQKRITEKLRGTYPDLSPDKKHLVFVKNEAGHNNLYIMNRDDNSLKQLTDFSDGTHLYKPRWSPDGSSIVFTLHRGSTIDIARIDADGSNLGVVVSSDGQDRDPVWTSDGASIVFSSDLTGIPNLYSMHVSDGSVRRLTNVIGAAFQPDVSPADTTIAFSYYGAEGYELRLMPMSEGEPVQDSSVFRKNSGRMTVHAESSFPLADSKPYRMKTLDFSFMPLIRNDQGNMKIGSYIIKSEVIDQGNFMFAGAFSPTNMDTDLYARFEYRKMIPTAFVEMYRVTRSVDRNENYMEEYGTVTRKRVYDLNEIDFGLNYQVKDRHEIESRLIYSQYNARVEYTHFLTGSEMHKPYYTYSLGFDLELMYHFDRFARSRDEDINPRGGREVEFRYDRFINFFLDDFEYVGFLKEKYKRYAYNRYFLRWHERIPVPHTKKHTLVLGGQFNLIDRQVDNFYENQLGGPGQMRGYTFYSMSGRKNVMASAIYRFPILFDVRKHFFFWDLNHIYMGFFADIGKAWNKQSLNLSTKGFKRDAGAELRIDSISFYNFPTMIELSAAYGPDDTWIRHYDEELSKVYWKKDEQDPWKFYVSLLFGFDD